MKTLNDILEEIHYNQTKEYYYNIEDIYNLKAYAVFTKPYDKQKFFLIGGVTKNEKKQVVLLSQPDITYKGSEELFYFIPPKQLSSFNMDLEIFSRRKGLDLLLNDTPIAYKKAVIIAKENLINRINFLEKTIKENTLPKDLLKEHRREILNIKRSIKTLSLI